VESSYRRNQALCESSQPQGCRSRLHRANDLASYYCRRDRVLAVQKKYTQTDLARKKAVLQAKKHRSNFREKYEERRGRGVEA
jgi:hypothetical protein